MGSEYKMLSPEDERSLYRERARLVAFLAAHYPAEIAYSDPAEPDWPVIIIVTPAGQLSWYLAQADLDLFPHVLQHEPGCAGTALEWDRHTTKEKYLRLTVLTHGKSGLQRTRVDP
jgi:hypothetical protein